ncbi:HD-GYP domain-containing protein [Paenibacillus chondroitinus]|uniref:HD-GYP domain-containing protein n=1 Tax=Paenibacillus chondroitinus TaxID=59842 RepID=A0ABU6DJ60_9BACL|nr:MULTISPECIES: HD-GYP domain-containing protein [Paenibacillus]MCY9661229.1 HD-GYP domain-containing protein [Paenibacillus anseongense]MEB4797347.1 HD-GYP domain-containing protein [Paenibacillus chondroitinus]
MLLMPINKCHPGMRLAKNIYNEDGMVLLAVNVELTQRLIDRLFSYGIDYIYIADSRTDDVIQADIIQDETRSKAIHEIRHTFKRVMEDSNKRGAVSYYDIGRNFRDVMNMIIDDLSAHQGAMVMLNNMNIKDNYLFQHSVNVSIYAIMLGISYGYSREKLETLGLGALLHDIGKTKIPLGILRKPSQLTSDEFKEMKNHTTYGFQILKDEPNIPLLSAHCALQHHERINGSGYPRGLQGPDINEFARWIGLVDSYDAMTTTRVYRRPLLPHEAMEQLFAGSGTMYDQSQIALFRDKIAIYPLGITVKLNTGEFGIVSKLNLTVPQRPVVRILQDETGRELKEPYEIDLSIKHSILISEIGEIKIEELDTESGMPTLL